MRKQIDDSSRNYGGRREILSAAVRAKILFGLSVAVFIFSVVMCLYLIDRSGEVEPMPTQVSKTEPLEYEVNTPPTQPIMQGEDDPYRLELCKPESLYGSTVINILLLGVDKDVNDTLILCSVDLAERTLAMLSIPRDTYIAGDYAVPKAKNIYSAYDADKRVTAVSDAVRGMFGFAVDYYFVLDEATLSRGMSLVEGFSFEVPESPAYHSLKGGTQIVDGEKAFELFRFKKSWTDVETDPARVQRTFLLSLIDALLEDEARISEVCVKLSEVADTDLSVEELAYLAYLLADFSFEDAFSRALPGGEKEIEKQVYYEVAPEKAVEMLNEHFNPMQKELSVYTVNFRQEQGASGEGEFSDYGHSTGTTEKTETDTSDGETDPDSSDPTEESENEEDTQETDPPAETEATEAPQETGDSDNGTT